MNLNKFKKLKAKVDHMIRDYSRLEGSLGNDLEALEEKFECSSLEEGKKRQALVKKQVKKIEKQLSTATLAFEKEWESVLDADDEEESDSTPF